jgi:hypothetical protein
MKNKRILFIILIVAFIVAISIFFILRKYNDNNIVIEKENNIVIEKGYELFGNEHCSGHWSTIVDGWPSYSTCKICGITKHNDVPHSDFIICPECSKITGRCTKCGKLLK